MRTHRIRHEMKCWPEFFEPTMRGIKRFELRRDDRDGGFMVGDELLLKEWEPDTTKRPILACGYTGREVVVRVDYIMPVATVDKLMDLEIPYPAEHAILSVSLVH